jgi:protein TonB
MKIKSFRALIVLIVGLGVTALGVGAFALVRSFVTSAAPPAKRIVQEIHLIRPPPPPPDAPPPPPPPPDEKVDIPDPQDKPDPTPNDEPPPAANLGLDAEGGAGGDAFGLVGRKGGRDLIGSGGNAVSWYATMVSKEIMEKLGSIAGAHKRPYKVAARVWLRDDGTVERIKLIQSTGDHEQDEVIEGSGSTMGRMEQAPPAEWANPMTVQLVSHS